MCEVWKANVELTDTFQHAGVRVWGSFSRPSFMSSALDMQNRLQGQCAHLTSRCKMGLDNKSHGFVMWIQGDNVCKRLGTYKKNLVLTKVSINVSYI